MMRRPWIRRLVAALLLLGAATGSVLFWNAGSFDAAQFGINLAVAIVGFVSLHLRWRQQERKALSKGQVKDIFS